MVVPVPAFDATWSSNDGVSVIEFHGELDLATRATLEALGEMICSSTAPLVVLDFERLTFVDAGSLQRLARVRQELQAHNRELVLRNVSRFTRKLLRIVDLDGVLRTEDAVP
jgi:anti-sigma B factor antagonist